MEITDRDVKFHDAADLWGKDTYASEDEIKQRIGIPDAGVMVIGPAGEKRVRFAVVENDYWRSSGRTGMGAVLGSKKLKAIAFHGQQARPIADPEGLKDFARDILTAYKDHPAANAYRNHGTPMMVALLNKAGGFPTRYWSQGRFDKWQQISAENMADLVREKLVDRSVTLEVLNTGTAVTVFQNLKNGRQILATGNPVFNKDGEIELVVVNDRDITELNRMRRELEESRALARSYRSGIAIETMKKKLPSDIVIRSESMLLALDMAKSVAEVDSTILIQGESGVGKGVLARYIHQCSKRASSLFVPVNCSAIPESLIESELFGYEEGAFTGARTKGKMGLLEMAEGGTLFLDEVGDLPLTVQVKILRFMEEKVVVRIGSTSPRKLDTRIIAATHRNLNDMVENEKFRKDLYFRLNVVPIVIPPLRERLEDIPALAHFFLSEINRKHSTNKIILPPAIDLICTYSFPGNVRELANLIERLVVLTPQNYIGIDDLPDYVQKDELGVTSCFSGNGLNLNKELARLEKKIITRALKLYGSQRKAAGPLGIDQSTLARKIKKHGTDFDAITHRNDNIH